MAARKTRKAVQRAAPRATKSAAARHDVSIAQVRARALERLLVRHYEAASRGRRTQDWGRSISDANVAAGASLATLRALARDLRRNNPWVRRGIQVISNNTVGWGLLPTPVGDGGAFMPAWKAWAETTQCDAAGRLTFSGIQRQAMDTTAEAGEVLIRRRWRRPEDGLALPLQLQLLEPDHLDTQKDNQTGSVGGPIIQGVEFDALGRRAAYWLFSEHPGASRATGASKRVPASEIIHHFRTERPGQVRGVSWCAPIIMRVRDFDQYEDATILRQQIAALFAAFVTDPNGDPTAEGVGEQGTDAVGLPIDEIGPGAVHYLAPGQTVEFPNPPVVQDGGFTERTLRSIAMGIGVTYEDVTGDYTKVNYSSGRLGWLAHWTNVDDWRWNMLVPQLCDPVWAWAVEAAVWASIVPAGATLRADWTPPPRPMIDPGKEGTAYQQRVRSGAMTPDEMVREQGRDPETHWREYAASLKRLDELGIVIDSDARKVSQAGLTQARPQGTVLPGEANGGGRPTNGAAEEEDADEVEDEADRGVQ
jgi:lambda family phage portal protein